MPDEPRSLDILGIKPIADSISKLTSASVDSAAAFLSRICLPAAEEFGLLLRDRVSSWRASNFASIAQKAERKLKASHAPSNAHAHPRLVFKILDEGSWIEDDFVQELWAGLLASSCTASGVDDSNLRFVTLLSDLTQVQVRILNFLCQNATKIVSANGLVAADGLVVTLDVLQEVAQENDFYRLDRELDHLRAIELIGGGFHLGTSTDAEAMPTALALQLYVRGQGSRRSPVDFFGLQMPEREATEQGGAESNDDS